MRERERERERVSGVAFPLRSGSNKHDRPIHPGKENNAMSRPGRLLASSDHTLPKPSSRRGEGAVRKGAIQMAAKVSPPWGWVVQLRGRENMMCQIWGGGTRREMFE